MKYFHLREKPYLYGLIYSSKGNDRNYNKWLKNSANINAQNNSINQYYVSDLSRLDSSSEILLQLLPFKDFKNKSNIKTALIESFKKWGISFGKNIGGQWIFAYFSFNEKKLLIIRDVNGCSTIYYTKHKNFFIFSQSLNHLLTFPGLTISPNEEYLGGPQKIVWNGNDKTAYQNIYRLPRGHYLSYQNNSLCVKKYWDILSIQETPYDKNMDCTGDFLEKYDGAVSSALSYGTNTGIMLSSGLDSTSVALLAADTLNKSCKTLHSYTSIPLTDKMSNLFKNRNCNEQELVNLFCKNKNISPNFIPSEKISIIDGIIKFLLIHPQPSIGAVNSHWIYNIYKTASNNNVDLLLNGQNGNLTVSYAGDIHSLFTDILNLYKHINYIKAYIKINNKSTNLKFFTKFLLSYCALHKDFKRISQSKVFNSFLTNNFEKKIGIQSINTINFNKQITYQNYRHMFYEKSCMGFEDIYSQLDIHFKMKSIDPTFDKNIIDFCFSIPNNQYFQHGIQKLLIRKAFHNKLPDKLLWSNKKGLQSSDVFYRLALEQSRISNILDKFHKSNYIKDILNTNDQKEYLNQIINNPASTSLGKLNFFVKSISSGLFLLKLEGHDINSL